MYILLAWMVNISKEELLVLYVVFSLFNVFVSLMKLLSYTIEPAPDFPSEYSCSK